MALRNRNKPDEGAIKIGTFSGLRKLMRAARRGKIPDERLVIIETAERKVAALKNAAPEKLPGATIQNTRL